MSDAVRQHLGQIEQLSEEDRVVLEERLPESAEANWKHEAEQARQLARQRGRAAHWVGEPRAVLTHVRVWAKARRALVRRLEPDFLARSRRV
jgi:hypothetical protein